MQKKELFKSDFFKLEKEKFKFKKYEINHNQKKYIVMEPINIRDNLWIIDWADWWDGTFLDGSVSGLKKLTSCFAFLGFNPHVIIYLPIKDCLIPEGWTGNPTNGKYDVLFMTEQSRVKSSTWLEIRKKLKYAPYKKVDFKFEYERIRPYFKKHIKKLEPTYKKLRKSRADNWLYGDTAFFIFPTVFYQESCIDLKETFLSGLTYEDFKSCYNEEYDSWTCSIFTSLVYDGNRKTKYTEEKPYLTLKVELYDLEIVNMFKKKKEKLVLFKNRPTPIDYARNDHYIKITIGGN